MEIETCT